jgi:hypothetical protein
MNLTANGEATYGHTEKAGAWDIDLGVQGPAPPASLNRIADNVSGAFVDAFADIATVEHAEGTVIDIGEDGRILSVWGEVPLVSQEGQFRPVPDVESGDLTERGVLSGIMLVCAVTVVQDDAHRLSDTIQDGLYFHYDSGLSGLVGELAQFDSAFARVDVEIEPWVDAPLHGGKFLDNRAAASLNRPRLEQALRRWEAEVGKPISNVTSVVYGAFVDRYGFRPGGQPDPE